MQLCYLHVVYSITIHVDPLDHQRPLCVTHHPELNAIGAHKIGSVIKVRAKTFASRFRLKTNIIILVIFQGNRLSMENLLTRTVIVRAQIMLTDIKKELLSLSPGSICASDIPLCLSVPVLWPCQPHELLHLRVDAAQGQIRAAFACDSIKGPLNVLRDLENAFNRPSARQVSLDRGSSSDFRAGARKLRGLVAEDARWQAQLVEIFSQLRCFLGQWRITTANIQRPVRDTLPISVSAKDLSEPPYGPLLLRAQERRVALSFVQLLPNDDYYLVCEVAPTQGLSVVYKYYLMKCVGIPEVVGGLRVASKGRWLSHDPNKISGNVTPDNPPGVALRITHFVALSGGGCGIGTPSSSSAASLVTSTTVTDPAAALMQQRARQLPSVSISY